MQIEQFQHQLDSLNREISRLETQSSSIITREIAKQKQINDMRSALTRCTSFSQIQSKNRSIEQYSRELSRILDEKKRITETIARKVKEKSNLEEKIGKQRIEDEKKRQKEQNHAIQSLNSHLSQQRASVFPRLSTFHHSMFHPMQHHVTNYDVFISYASEDKETFVTSVGVSLQNHNPNIWWDYQEIRWGDSIRKQIDDGLANARLGIVVISPDYLKKYWTQYEYNGLLQQEANVNGRPIVLPIWHRISKEEILKYSPTLADRSALNTTTFTPNEIALELVKILEEINNRN